MIIAQWQNGGMYKYQTEKSQKYLTPTFCLRGNPKYQNGKTKSKTQTHQTMELSYSWLGESIYIHVCTNWWIKSAFIASVLIKITPIFGHVDVRTNKG